jgi:uncharacterized protein (DUF342 family)
VTNIFVGSKQYADTTHAESHGLGGSDELAIKPKQIEGMQELMERVRHLEETVEKMENLLAQKEAQIEKLRRGRPGPGERKLTKP